MVPNEKVADSVRAVDRALEILMAFTSSDYELSAADLLKRVKLSRPTLYRLLNTLEQSGFVVSTGEPQKFRLGPSVGHLAHVWTSSLDVGVIAQPMMHRLRNATGETVALFLRQGVLRICVAELPSAHPLSFKRGVGYQEKIVLGASGRVILAFANEISKPVENYAVHSKLDPKSLTTELTKIRKQGYATSRDELIEGAVAVAAPFFNSAGQVTGSIAIFGPSVRLKDKKVSESGKLLISEARLLSAALGDKNDILE